MIKSFEQNIDENTTRHRLTTIAISSDNYLKLRDLGKTGDSFNDVLTKLLLSHSNGDDDSK